MRSHSAVKRRLTHDNSSVHPILKLQGKFASCSLKPAFPKAGQFSGGYANLSPSLPSVKAVLALELLPCSPCLFLWAVLPFSSHPLCTIIWWLRRIPGSFCLTRNAAG